METLLSALRHLTKDLFKVGIVAYDTVADTVAQTTEGMKDIMAEARAEINAPSPQPANPPAPSASNPLTGASNGPDPTGHLPDAKELTARASAIPTPPKR